MKKFIQSVGSIAIASICFYVFRDLTIKKYIFFFLVTGFPISIIWCWIVDKIEGEK